MPAQTVVVAGWGQVTQPKHLETKAKDPMGLMVQASGLAAGMLKSPKCFAAVDGLFAVKSLSACYNTPAVDLARQLGLNPKVTMESRIGGNSPQSMINRAAGMIARKELSMVLVAGAEAYVPRGNDPARERTGNALLKGIPKDYKGEDASGAMPVEIRYGIEHPIHGFPLFETALWAESGLDLKTYMSKTAAMWAGFSRVAKDNPYAWSRTPRSPEEILTVSERNRPISFPYPKYMNSFVTVDQGAAVILMSEQLANDLCPAKGTRVYFCGGGSAKDRQPYIIQKTEFTVSHPLKAAADQAFAVSGSSLDRIEAFDLYSCFPCAVNMAKKMMGITDEDPRPLTLTGGLGFFGGPGNNYNLHAVATLCEKIYSGRLKTGMVTALGWFLQKHAAGIYSALPPQRALDAMGLEDERDNLAGPPPMDIDPDPAGNGIIDTYTIVYNVNQTPAYAVIYGKTEAGKRFIARSLATPQTYAQLSGTSMVGARVSLEQEQGSGLTIAQFI